MEQNEDGAYIITNDHELQAINYDREADYVLGNDIDASGTSRWVSTSENSESLNKDTFDEVEEFETQFAIAEGTETVTATGGPWWDMTTTELERGENYDVEQDGQLVIIYGTDEHDAEWFNVSYETQPYAFGFEPIGEGDVFTGSLDGQGYEVTNLYIDRPHEQNVGLFGIVSEGSVTNLSVVNGDVAGRASVGLVAGRVEDSDISDIHSTGVVDGRSSIGGVVGNAHGDETVISDATSSATVSGWYTAIGGLVGSLRNGFVENSSATGDVFGGERSVGGLVGGANREAEITNSHATGTVNGENRVGGLVGYVQGSYYDVVVSSSYATGNVTGENRAGGLVGRNDGTIDQSYATGNVTNSRYAGGLVGSNRAGEIRDSYAIGSVHADISSAGSLVGIHYGHISGTGEIHDSYATGAVRGKDNTGGLIGFSTDHTIVNNSYWTVDTTGLDSSDGGTGLTAAEMLGDDAEFSMNLDWDDTWVTGDANEYPRLWWQREHATIDLQEDLIWKWDSNSNAGAVFNLQENDGDLEQPITITPKFHEGIDRWVALSGGALSPQKIDLDMNKVIKLNSRENIDHIEYTDLENTIAEKRNLAEQIDTISNGFMSNKARVEPYLVDLRETVEAANLTSDEAIELIDRMKIGASITETTFFGAFDGVIHDDNPYSVPIYSVPLSGVNYAQVGRIGRIIAENIFDLLFTAFSLTEGAKKIRSLEGQVDIDIDGLESSAIKTARQLFGLADSAWDLVKQNATTLPNIPEAPQTDPYDYIREEALDLVKTALADGLKDTAIEGLRDAVVEELTPFFEQILLWCGFRAWYWSLAVEGVPDTLTESLDRLSQTIQDVESPSDFTRSVTSAGIDGYSYRNQIADKYANQDQLLNDQLKLTAAIDLGGEAVDVLAAAAAGNAKLYAELIGTTIKTSNTVAEITITMMNVVDTLQAARRLQHLAIDNIAETRRQ